MVTVGVSEFFGLKIMGRAGGVIPSKVASHPPPTLGDPHLAAGAQPVPADMAARMLSARSPAPRPSTRRWVPKRLLAPVDRHSVRIAMRAYEARVSRAGGATHATGSATPTAPAGVRRMVSLRAQNPRTMHLSPQHGHHTLAQHAPKNGQGRSEV